MDENINDSKSYIWSSFYENIVSGIQLYKKSITISLIIFKKPRKMTNNFFNNSFTRSSGHHQHFVVFFQDFRFSSKKSQIQEKLAKKIIYCTINFRSENLTHFTNLNSLDIEKNMLPQQSQKFFSLYKFSSKHLPGVRKIIRTAPFLDAQELNSRSTLKANVCKFSYICLRKFLFQRRSKILSGGVWGD